MDRVILHCDLNNFYASVECKLDPKLKEIPIAVGGSVENRHGIILAKNDIAKKFNITTGEAIFQAMKKCPNLTIIPPKMDEYLEYSKKTRAIYEEFTDLIEPFGIDECWLDVTQSQRLFGSGEVIAYKIKEKVKTDLGVTISVGVSFNKVLAKLGSDLKKPDAVTVLSKENYKNIIKNLDIGTLLGIGKSTSIKLKRYGINTLGDLSVVDIQFLKNVFGKQGIMLHHYVNGLSDDCVNDGKDDIIKSVGNSVTCKKDLVNNEEVFFVLYCLAEKVSHRMRKQMLLCNGVVVTYKTMDFKYEERQIGLSAPTRNPLEIAKAAMSLFKTNYNWFKPIRAVGVRGINLVNENTPSQINFLNDITKIQKLEKLETSVDSIRNKYGKTAINRGSLLRNNFF